MYSQGGVHKSSYQQLDEDERARITLDGEPTCELDLGSCNLSIFHALLNEPLDLSTDAYDRVFPGQRPLVKSYMTALFGNDGLLDRWPSGIVKRYRKKHGIEPDDIISASGMGQKVLTAYPAMRHLGQPGARWPDLMYREATTMVHTMKMLMARGIPSLPIHDGIIVPTYAAGEAVNALIGYFWRIVGVVPSIKAKTAPEEVQATVAEFVASHASLEPRTPDPEYL